MDEEYELALATEGQSAAAFSEDQWIAWEEQLALAPGLDAKRALINGPFGVAADHAYRAPLLTLLQVQELLDADESEEDGRADALLTSERATIRQCVEELKTRGCNKKADRLSHRLAVMELEVARRVGKSEAVIKDLSNKLATEMGLEFDEAAPACADVIETPLKTVLSTETLSTDSLLLEKMKELEWIEGESSIKDAVRGILCDVDVYARELFFALLINREDLYGNQQSLCVSPGVRQSLTIPAEARWWALEVILDEFPFEYADVDGYVAVIFEDLKRQRQRNEAKKFGCRKAHAYLSLTHLTQLMERDPHFLRDDEAFALRLQHLMLSKDQSTRAFQLEQRDSSVGTISVAVATELLVTLTHFSETANAIRAVILHCLLHELRFLVDNTDPVTDGGASTEVGTTLKARLFEYLKLPRADADFVNPELLRLATANEMLFFDGGSIRRSTMYTVDEVSCALTGKPIDLYKDKQLITSVLYALWSTGQMTADDDEALYKYLKQDFVDAHKAESMIVSGRGDLATWKDKLPRKGAELSEWSSTTEISFCESNPTHFMPEDDLSIFVHVRNVKSLTVQVYEVRTVDYYARKRHEVQGDICLDGLLPNEEHVVDLSHLAPWQKARVPIKLSSPSQSQAQSQSPTTGRRGVFVVEVYEKDVTCRAVLRQGHLRHVERVTSRGHEFIVLSERGEVIKDASLMLMNVKSGRSKAQPPRVFEASGDTGVIVVPFRQPGESSEDQFCVVLRHDDFGCFVRQFEYLEASFTLDAQMYIDSEQLRPGEDAALIVRPFLSVGLGSKVSVNLMTDIKVCTRFMGGSNETATGEQLVVQEMGSIQELVGGKCIISIPIDAKSFTVTINARIASYGCTDVSSLEKLPQVCAAKEFTVQRLTQFNSTYTAHFSRRIRCRSPRDEVNKFEYFISVLGHNGEACGRKAMTVSIYHLHFTSPLIFDMESDEQGEIILGDLQSVQEVRARFSDHSANTCEWSWELPNLRTYLPQMMNCIAGDTVQIPIPFAFMASIDEWIEVGLISVCQVYDLASKSDEPVLQDVTSTASLSSLKNGRGQVVAVTLKLCLPGKYLLYVRPLDIKHPLTVSASVASCGFIVQQKMILFMTPRESLTINDYWIDSTHTNDDVAMHIQLSNAKYDSTQVWVIFKQFIGDAHAKFSSILKANGLVGDSYQPLRRQQFFINMIALKNEYLKMRKISDEYTYILQRRAAVRTTPNRLFMGSSSLPVPTLIQNPLVVESTDMEELTLREGEKVSGFHKEEYSPFLETRKLKKSSLHKRFGSGLQTGHGISSTSFLPFASIAIPASVDKDGSAIVLLNNLPIASNTPWEVVILAYDMEYDQVTSLEVQVDTFSEGEQSIVKRDVRLSSEEALVAGDPSLKIQRHEVLCAGQSRVLPRSFSSKYALYETIQSAMDLWSILCSHSAAQQVIAMLKKWPLLKEEQKKRFYMENASDDLNVFLYIKDRGFFEGFVKASIRAKVSKSLIDHYVLDNDAMIETRYLIPSAFHRLSVIEKIMVAERASAPSKVEALCQHVVDSLDGQIKIDKTRSPKLTHIFDTLLSQGAVKPEPLVASAPSLPLAPPSLDLFSGAPVSMSFGQGFGFSRAASQPSHMNSLDYSYDPTSVYQERATVQFRLSESSEEEEVIVDEDDDDFGVESLSSDDDDDVQDDNEDNISESSNSKHDHKKKMKKRYMEPYVAPGRVRCLREKRFHVDQQPSLDGCNMFWRDYALHLIQRVRTGDAKLPFVSSHFPEALHSFTEGLLAISVLDLPFEVIEPTVVTQVAGGQHVQLEAKADVVLYHQGIGVGPVTQHPNSVLIIKQRLITQEDRSSVASLDFSELRPVREFVVGRIYSCVVSVSNISSKRLKNVNLLLQIPRGSIPLTDSGFYTKNEIIEVAPHDTNTYAFDFYFPEVGSFTQYPAHAALDGEVIAWATTDTQFTDPISVVLKASTVDLTSWRDVAARGSLEDVLAFMTRERTLHTLDVNVLAWRCRDAVFYFGLVPYLRERWVFYESIWKYAFMHSDMQGMRELCLSKSDLVRKLGHGVRTEIVRLEDVYRYERFDTSFRFDHTEFGPLLSRRAHRVSGQVSSGGLFSSGTEVSAATSDNEPPRVLHKKAREYYRTLCHVLSHRATLTAEQLVVMSYFLILFNRIADAIEVFERAKELSALEMRDHEDAVESSVVADYIDSYLDFFRPRENDVGDAGSQTFPVARRNVAKYSQLLHDRWQQRFSRLHEVLDEFDDLHAASQAKVQAGVLAGGAKATSDGKVVPDDGEVRLDARVNGSQVLLESQNLGACEISFYRVDVELMFSSEPFDSFSESAASKSSLLLIKPWHQVRVALSEAGDALYSQSQVASEGGSVVNSTAFELPAELAAQPMLLRIREVEATRRVASVAPPIDLTRCYFNSQLQVVVTKQAGLLQVLHRGLPVTSCYVKVFAKTGDSNGGCSAKAEFYKDGYTDVIGKFDYAAVNGDLLSRVEKFSVLVAHPTLGTSVHQVLPPVLAVTSGEFKDKQVQEALWF